MTASNNRDSHGKSTATPKATHDAYTCQQAHNLLVDIQEDRGWKYREPFLRLSDVSEAQGDRCLSLLEEIDEINILDFGNEQLIHLTSIDPQDAIAEVSDEKERFWRASNGDSFPALDLR